MEKITLIIVDGQYDFIEGGKLPVKGGTKALDNVVELLNSGKVGQVITTQDWHVGNHCSFKYYGGDFPEHCVENTHGAEIYGPILDAIRANNICTLEYYKGHYMEEFTAFTGLMDNFSNYIRLYVADAKETGETYIEFCKEENIVICGLAGDICVLNTIKAINPYLPVSIYLDGIASLDGGTTLKEFMKEHYIKEYDPKLIRH